MALDADEEILQDFLVEAEEILEKLGEQLVQLEKQPNDKELLNSVFRGFHTIKGGAGFLNITPMVTVCHRAEDVFNLLRQGERVVDAHLMDIILKVIDIVSTMFEEVRQREMPAAADPAIIQALEQLAKNEPQASKAAATPAPAAQTSAPKDVPRQDSAIQKKTADAAATPPRAGTAASDEITDDEFESLLDQLHGSGAPGGVAGTSVSPTGAQDAGTDSSGNITDEEFEKLLDNLHGSGKHSGVPAPAPAVAVTSAAGKSDEITESEFDALLDQIHGKVAPVAAQKSKDEEIKKPEKPQPAKETAQPQAETTVRVDTRRLDEIMNLVGELVLLRNRVKTFMGSTHNEELNNVINNIDLVTSDLQASVMKTRMQPIKKVFGRFPRVVRDLARTLNKEISLELKGEDTDLDKNLVEALADPLVHLVRNAVDHGIEMPDVRVAAGKSKIGRVVLSAEQEGDHILLTIVDDGAGMDPHKLRAIAVKKGLMDEAAASRMDDRQCYNLIFMPGFSTKAEISDISGRGVGMDVVKTRISQLNGSVVIDSELGKGSRIAIKVPLTLAIMPTLMIMLSNQIFALPLVSVVEIFNLDLSKTNVVDGHLSLLSGTSLCPYFI